LLFTSPAIEEEGLHWILMHSQPVERKDRGDTGDTIRVTGKAARQLETVGPTMTSIALFSSHSCGATFAAQINIKILNIFLTS
jgi:hypothetical protein